MQAHLYVDNFRGFRNTLIPITDVNFLVGENSTGKTSILALLKLFSSPQFWFEQVFEQEDIHLGHFEDIVSAHASDRSYFRIGQVYQTRGSRNESEGAVVAYLFTFVNRNGVPELARCSATFGKHLIHIHLAGQKISYRVEEAPPTRSLETMVSTVLPSWNQEHRRPTTRYARLTIPKGLPRGMRLPPTSVFAMVLETIRPKSKQREDRSLSFVLPPFGRPEEFVWVAPIRTKARRTYDELKLVFSAEGLHTPYLIRRILGSKTEATRFRRFITRVGGASGLFQSVQIRPFGRGVTAPFEVEIVIDNKALNLSSVGYGVSQALPVLVELLARPKNTWFAIQQPEVHLHPRAQAALGDVFFEMAAKEGKRFIIETHSDFTIDRFRRNYKRHTTERPASQILFFERRRKHNTVTALKIGADGRLPTEQPASYRSFFLKEALETVAV